MNLDTNVWRQRREIGGPWGWMFEVETEHGQPLASGWYPTEEQARRAVAECFKRYAPDAETMNGGE